MALTYNKISQALAYNNSTSLTAPYPKSYKSSLLNRKARQ